MSLPAKSIQCTMCSFHAGDVVTWGAREYVLNDGVRIDVPRKTGWCHVCSSIAPIEDIEEAIYIAKLEHLKKITEEPPPPAPPPSSIFNIFRHRHVSQLRTAQEEWDARLRKLKVEIADAEDLLHLIANRKVPCRCLACGSDKVEVGVSIRDAIRSEANQSREQGFLHPGCGGELYWVDSGIRFAIRPSMRRYRPDGTFIEKLDLDGYTVPSGDYFSDRENENTMIRSKRRQDSRMSKATIPKFKLPKELDELPPEERKKVMGLVAERLALDALKKRSKE